MLGREKSGQNKNKRKLSFFLFDIFVFFLYLSCCYFICMLFRLFFFCCYFHTVFRVMWPFSIVYFIFGIRPSLIFYKSNEIWFRFIWCTYGENIIIIIPLVTFFFLFLLHINNNFLSISHFIFTLFCFGFLLSCRFSIFYYYFFSLVVQYIPPSHKLFQQVKFDEKYKIKKKKLFFSKERKKELNIFSWTITEFFL